MSQPVTLDSLMTDFVCDMVVADDELSDSIFTCVDNFIDDLCLRVMEDENNIFETDRDEGDLPFNYIIDKVLEKIDTTEDIANISYCQALKKRFDDDDEHLNNLDPDYCEEINFDEVDPESFQLYIPKATINDGSDEPRAYFGTDDGTGVDSGYDSIFNA